jgi:putative transposase
MLYVRFPLNLRSVEGLLFERGIDICRETVRRGGTGSGRCSLPTSGAGGFENSKGPGAGTWMDFVRLNGEMIYLWRAVDHEGEVLESSVTKIRDKPAAFRFIREA